LKVPFRSQYDASPYQFANCGPAALAMVLQAYGVDVSNQRLRDIADQLQGTTGYSDGVALDYLQMIARQAGLRTDGLTGPDGSYRRWSIGDVIQEVRRGYPVITLVHFAALPRHATSGSTSDHYIVVVGVTSAGFVINDPAAVAAEGYRQLLRPEQLLAAWSAAGIQNQAVAFLPPTTSPIPLPASAGNLVAAKPAPTPAVAALPVTLPTAASPAIASEAAVGRAGAGLGPPPQPSLVELVQRIHDWQHASPVATLKAGPPTATTSGGTLVLAERDTSDPSPLPTLLVIGIIGAIGLAIVKAPRGSGYQ